MHKNIQKINIVSVVEIAAKAVQKYYKNFRRLFMKKAVVILALFAAILAGMPMMSQAQDAGVAKLTYGPDKWIDLHLLFQMQYTNTYKWDSSVETDSDAVWASDFAPKRMRMIFNGQVAPNVTFFVDTDIINNVDVSNKAQSERYFAFLQDAYINYKFGDELQIATGMMLIPFMHHNRQSAVSLLGVNYNTTVVNIAESTVWRDYGIEFRGLLANKMIDYRIGLFDGIERSAGSIADDSDNINNNGIPRVTGRIQINLKDAEDGFFYSENYLGKKTILSFGAGIDYMKDARIINGSQEDYLAWTVDAIIDYPLASNMVLAFQAAYVHMENRPGTLSSVAGITMSGLTMPEKENGYFAQIGLLLNNTWQPVIKYASWVYQEAQGTDDVTVSYLTFGLNYFINGHNANIKLEYQMPVGEFVSGTDLDKLPNQRVVTLQAQVFI